MFGRPPNSRDEKSDLAIDRTPMNLAQHNSQPAARKSTYSVGILARLAAFIAVGILALAAARQTAAQDSDASAVINREYAIKATFLYHFSTYVQWPAEAAPHENQPFVIGLYQSDPFGTALSQIAQSKTVAGHPIEVRVLKSTEGIAQCQILFVPKSVTPEQRAEALRATKNLLILVVGETDDFIERGGSVQFFLEGNKMRFAFSAELAKRADLKVSSKLLSLAKIVPKQ